MFCPMRPRPERRGRRADAGAGQQGGGRPGRRRRRPPGLRGEAHRAPRRLADGPGAVVDRASPSLCRCWKRRHPDRRRQLLLHRRHPPRQGAEAEGHPLRRRRHQRRRLGPGARLLPDDRRRAATVVQHLDPIFATLAPGAASRAAHPGPREGGGTAEHGYLHCGPSGAGHFVKMVHNGIEYGHHGRLRRGARTSCKHANVGKQDARGRRRDDAAARPGALPVRLRPARRRRGLAARQRDRLLAARPDRPGAAARSDAGEVQRAGSRTPARAAGRSTPRSTRPCRRRS